MSKKQPQPKVHKDCVYLTQIMDETILCCKDQSEKEFPKGECKDCVYYEVSD
jgi:hypothetical protein